MNRIKKYTCKEIEDIIVKVTNGLTNLRSSSVTESCPIGIVSMDNWEWPQGVALFSMFKHYTISKNPATLRFLQEWFDNQIEKGLPEKNVNTMCPMLTMAYLYEHTKDEKYLPVLMQWADYAMYQLPRTTENGIQHIVSGNLNKEQIWVDTLYMTGLFLAKMGVMCKNEKYINESIYQYLIHIKYLTDKKSGLLFHGFNFDGRHNFANALWGRGNSWYTAGIVDYLDIVKLSEGVNKYFLQALLSQVGSLAKLQDQSGLWHTILDDKSSYLEASASAAFAYGIFKAVRLGYIPKVYENIAFNALDGIISCIDDNGIVGKVSYGTPVFNSIDEYKKIEICPMPYGQSMALMLLVEALMHTDSITTNI